MRISFDLDDTLICHQLSAKHERNRVPLLLRLWLNEPLRLGTRMLIAELQQYGHEIWIYTSSCRHPFLVKFWLRCYGIRVAEVINQKLHDRVIRSSHSRNRPSKNPHLFGIDLHVDDAVGVKMEAARYGFEVLIIEPTDREWTAKVLQVVNDLNLILPK